MQVGLDYAMIDIGPNKSNFVIFSYSLETVLQIFKPISVTNLLK